VIYYGSHDINGAGGHRKNMYLSLDSKIRDLVNINTYDKEECVLADLDMYMLNGCRTFFRKEWADIVKKHLEMRP